MRPLMWLLFVLLLGLGVVLDALALGTFASMSLGAPLWLRSLGSIEGALGQLWGNLGLGIFTRAMLLVLLGSLVLGLAAYVKPRKRVEETPRPLTLSL